jgi:hypothetical protein
MTRIHKMNHLRSIWRRLNLLAMVAACWLASHGTALAAEAEQERGGGMWVPYYGLVLLAIVLGMLGVSLGSRRREREKPETYSKTTLTKNK